MLHSILLTTCVNSIFSTFCHVFSYLKCRYFEVILIIDAIKLDEYLFTKEDRIADLGVVDVDSFNHDDVR